MPERHMPKLITASLRTSTKAAFLVAVTVLAYLPALRNGFIWDDDAWLMHNRTLEGVNGLYRLWSDLLALQQYYPITGTAFWIQYQLWGFHPFGYHAVNVALHTLNVVLFWFVLRKLGLRGAWFAAAIFAVHPIMVESVAWVTEIKNLLSTAFFLGSVLAYLNFENLERRDLPRRGNWFVLSLLFFVCALLSKSVTCSLPVVLAILIWWKRERTSPADFRPVLPYFLVGLPIGLLTAWLEVHHVGAAGVSFDLEFYQRCIVAGRAIVFYFFKLVWPNDLTFIYPRWQVTSPWLLLVPAFVALCLFTLWFLRKRIGKAPLAAAAFFVVTLGPILGFFNGYAFQFSFVADHWQYLSSLGVIALASAFPNLLSGVSRHVRSAALGFILVALALLTARQSFIYTSKDTLWRDTLLKNPNCWLAHNNLGVDLIERGVLRGAEEHYRAAVRLNLRYYEAENNLGEALLARNQVEEAARHINRSIEINPTYAASHWNQALVLARQARSDEAYEIVDQGLQQRPIYLAGVNAFAWLLATSPDERVRKPRGAEELAHRCCEATRYANPRFLDTLAAAYANQNQFGRAAETASQAIDHAARLGETTLACEIARRLELYKTGKGYLAFRR
ncbi:MAG: O-GlcNAc transferase [Verrucomicrobia bacterium]|nr:MAG: O-GlcNAc transferase [Verrucomicrobiota bacterium]